MSLGTHVNENVVLWKRKLEGVVGGGGGKGGGGEMLKVEHRRCCAQWKERMTMLEKRQVMQC